MDADDASKQARLHAALNNMPRVLNANISAGSAASAKRRTAESYTAYAYQPSKIDKPLDKSRHLRKDGVKEYAARCALACRCVESNCATHIHTRTRAARRYVEKALMLHDERGGMPVVASPIWAPKTSSVKKPT